MTSLIILPTTNYIYHAALTCSEKCLTVEHIFISARQNIAKKITTAKNTRGISTIRIFAPFMFSEELEDAIKQTSKNGIKLEWYGEEDRKISERLDIFLDLEVHSTGTLPTFPPHEKNIASLENYLRYKKTLTFLGDKNGDLAIGHLKEAIEQFSKSPIIPKHEKPAVIAFAETDFPAIEGRSEKMTRLKRDIHRVGSASLNKILLLGETGTGKEAAAFFLHILDPKRREGKFGSINCAVLQEDLLISELFGHEKGAFTGATKQKRGLVSELHGGTLFLDELPDLPPRVQAMLLRFLESGTYTPLGSTDKKRSNTKIVSAAQESRLMEKISTKEFRLDLFYRIAGKKIKLPSLNEIPEDLPVLIVHLAYKVGEDFEKRDQAISYFLGRMAELQKHSWPGNVRELANYITRRMKLGDEEEIELEDHLGFFIENPTQINSYGSLTPINRTTFPSGSSIDTIHSMKKTYARNVYKSLTSQKVPQSQISKRLGVSVNTLKRLLKNDS